MGTEQSVQNGCTDLHTEDLHVLVLADIFNCSLMHKFLNKYIYKYNLYLYSNTVLLFVNIPLANLDKTTNLVVVV